MKRSPLPVLLLALMIAEIHTESFTVSDIRVNGLQRASAGSASTTLPLNVGGTIDDQTLVQAIHSLFKTGFLQDTQLNRDDNVLVVTVVGRPSISSIEIEGDRAISREDLSKGPKQSGLAEGEIFQHVTLEGVCSELQRQYMIQDRYSAKIDAEVIPQPRNRIVLKININEGTVAVVSHINVMGNTVFSEEDLTDLFKLKTINWLSSFENDDKYIHEKLSGDPERLRSYYLNRGYISMDIASAQVSITPGKRHVYIAVNVNEGEKYTIRDVKLTGDLKVPGEKMERPLLVQGDQMFPHKAMTTTSDLITRYLDNGGYIFANINDVPGAHDDDKIVSVTFVAGPDKRVYVNRINLRDNTKTEDEVLRREIRQMEGGWVSIYLIDRSKTCLRRLGYFKEANVETPAVPDTDDQVDVNYSVEGQPFGSITTSVDFAQSADLTLGGLVSQNNFLGTGNKVNTNLTRSEYQTRYNFDFANPYWAIGGVNPGYNAFYRKTDYDELDVDVVSYPVNSLGVGISIGYLISETPHLTHGLNVQCNQIDTGHYTTDEIYNFLDKEGDNFTNLKAPIDWSELTLNKGVLATRGHLQNLTLETTLPGSDLSPYRIDYREQVFISLTNNYTMRFHTELGYGDGYGSTGRLPFYENCYADGLNSARDFRGSTLGPRSAPSRAYKGGKIIPGPDERGRYTDPSQDSEVFSGNILITDGAELLSPLPLVEDQRQLRTMPFWDVGSIFDTDCPTKITINYDGIKTDNLVSSVGIGLTWITALGPLSFGLATPIKKPDNAGTQVFQFSLGQTF